jgi:tRNA dimethylallyltransferase
LYAFQETLVLVQIISSFHQSHSLDSFNMAFPNIFLTIYVIHAIILPKLPAVVYSFLNLREMEIIMAIPIFLLVGPTASRKTEVSIPLAQALNAEIVSIDSMQVYRGMDIGTAKPSLEVRSLVSHHFVDICDPWETFNTAMFVERASAEIREIRSRGREALLVGGTALYVKSLIEGIFEGPSANWEIRAELLKRPVEQLYEELCGIDPEAAQKIYAQDSRRIVRALEVYYTTGLPISVYQKQYTVKVAEYRPTFVGLRWDKQVLHERIAQRVTQMLAEGLVAETQKLLALPHPLSHTAAQAIGYKEVIAALGDPNLLLQLPETLVRNTRLFAKRQMTWLKRFPVSWLSVDAQTSVSGLVAQAMAVFRNVVPARPDGGG